MRKKNTEELFGIGYWVKKWEMEECNEILRMRGGFILFYLFVLFYLVSQSLRFWSNNFDQQVKRQPCNDTYRTTLDFVVETWYWFIRETTCRTMKTPVHFTCPIWRKCYSLLENSFKHISRRSPGQDFFIAPALKQILF